MTGTERSSIGGGRRFFPVFGVCAGADMPGAGPQGAFGTSALATRAIRPHSLRRDARLLGRSLGESRVRI